MKLLDFYGYLDKLKRTKRSGWVKAGIPDPENVSDHSFSTAILSMILANDLKVDKEKFIKMGLIHDLGESIIGDIIWFNKDKGIDRTILAKKEKDETEAMKKILETLGNKEYLDLWTEMEEGKTKEAKLHKDIDKLDLAFQAFFNEKRTGIKLDDFFYYAYSFIKNNEIKKILKEIKSSRNP